MKEYWKYEEDNGFIMVWERDPKLGERQIYNSEWINHDSDPDFERDNTDWSSFETKNITEERKLHRGMKITKISYEEAIVEMI